MWNMAVFAGGTPVFTEIRFMVLDISLSLSNQSLGEATARVATWRGDGPGLRSSSSLAAGKTPNSGNISAEFSF